ncbi:MAG: hypothetical protein KDA78_10630 [Planctomycetaceae bacterium]|nr:hypothetical protein [Planctomycetaceae bacterium]
MPDNEPNFDFLHERKPSDSAILDQPPGEQPVESQETQNDPAAEAKSPDSGLAWMDGPALYSNVDSSTKFTSALNSEQPTVTKSAEAADSTEPAEIITDTPVPETVSASSESEETPPAEDLTTSNSTGEEPEAPAPAPRETPARKEEASTGRSAELQPKAKQPEPDPDAELKEKAARRNKERAVAGMKSTILLSYASAVTLLCIYLIYQMMAGSAHNLESLPDLKPPMKDDEIAYRLVPEHARLAPGHTLKIGQSKRYGNLKVTPIAVEKASLKFVHYSGSATQNRKPVPDVLKLRLRFENVSTDQTFAPLDRTLVLKRIVDTQNPAWLRSNQFLSTSSHKGEQEHTLLLYDLEEFGDWNFADMPELPMLKPGESIELYLPSSPDWKDRLSGNVVWRVQFRKGYNPESRRGVTTLIEVQFNLDDINAA